MSGKTRVDCWGAGASGQTGNASFEDTLLPTEVPGSADLKFSAIASGSEFNCAVAAGTVRCWGEGADGQLGNNSTNKSASLVQASGLTTVSKKPGEICANGGKKILSGIDVDHSGTLSENEIISVRYVCTGEVGTPALVLVTDIEPGETCMFGGQLIKTGSDINGDGQLSENEIQSSYTVCSGMTPNLSGNIKKVATYLNQSCALLSNQTVQCWGRAEDGTDSSASPIPVNGISRAKDVAAGCALGSLSSLIPASSTFAQ